MALPRRQLGATGLSVSVLGFGASPLGSVFQVIDEDEGVAAVHEAVRLGINFFDCSPYYGDERAEVVLGRALRSLPRSEFVLSTKVGRYKDGVFDFSAARVTRSVEVLTSFKESMARLGVDFIDVLQCHDIEFGDLDQVVRETLPALQALKQAGKVRHIGITGLPLAVFRRVLEAAPPGCVDVALSYCRYHLADTALLRLLPLLRAKQVGVINASPLSMGLLTDAGPPAWHPAPPALKEACAAAAALCRARGGDLARLAIQHAVRHEEIATTLVGMCTREQVRSNVACAVAAFAPPSAEDVALRAAVDAVLAPVMGTTWSSGRPENNGE